jgi:predicted unusual protein kinase regulating ubiquinone biosynthesis (AarF/ABC1/UbiB family)
VDEAVRRWREKRQPPRLPEPEGLFHLPRRTPRPEAPLPALADVLRPIARRQTVVQPGVEDRAPAELRPITFKAGLFACVRRLFIWLWIVAYVLAGMFRDKLAGRDSMDRRAQRLREGLERVGGTFVKLGQQIAMRIDVIPWEYCVELSKMLDRMPPFELEDALSAVERSTGRPWQDVFSSFDPQPVGSASIACVYQALLKDGTKVAVKVRRPGIGTTFMADFRVLDWLFGLVEWLAIVRPGFTANLRREFRETLLEELDFRKEAHFQDIFRRNARRKARRDFFTAPRVHFDLSNDEVIVQEFVSGMWLWEVITAVEQNDPEGHALMARLNIDPGLVARRILWTAFWAMDENVFFHADPHPANIVVGPNSTLTFIDFGSCGSFNDEQRWALERVVTCMQNDDAEGMARATLKLLEPFLPVDVSALMKEAQAEYMRVLYTFRTKAKYTEWWERTTAKQWLAMVRVARQYNLPLNLHTLRMIRATLLYDTLVLRLDRTVDRYDEYAKFRRDRAAWARRRWRKRLGETTRQFSLRADELLETGDDLLDRAQQGLSSPVAGFSSVVDKAVFAFGILNRMAGRLIMLTGLAAAIVATTSYVRVGTISMSGTLSTVARNNAFLIAVAAIVALNVRHILFRLRDRDVTK